MPGGIGTTQPSIKQDSGQIDPPDAAAQARANDIVEALLESRALLDGQRKAEAQAEAEHTITL